MEKDGHIGPFYRQDPQIAFMDFIHTSLAQNAMWQENAEMQSVF